MMSYPMNDHYEMEYLGIPTRGGGYLFTAFRICMMAETEPPDSPHSSSLIFQVISYKHWTRKNKSVYS